MCFRLLMNDCAETSIDDKSELLHPIFVNLGAKRAIDEVKKYVENKYNSFEIQEDFHEIFVKDGNYGITISFVEEDNGTTISCYVYNRKKRLGLKKYLINFLLPIKENLKNYIKK